MGYSTDLNYELIDSSSIQDLLGDIKENFVTQRFLQNPNYYFLRRFKMLQAVCNMLKIVPSNEQWYFLLADADRLLCEACAGAGKTTMAQLKLIDAKLTQNVPGKNILALAYNNHAVKDMSQRHDEIIRRINNMHIPGLARDRDICCHTFHSFCMAWVEDYAQCFGINPKNYLLVEGGAQEAMRFVLNAYARKNAERKLFVGENIVAAFISLYTFAKETLTMDDPQRWNTASSFSDLKDFTIQDIQQIFKLYDNMKKLKNKMDFTDVIESMYELCKDPEIMARLRANYKIMLVDEYQDITPTMLRIIHIFMEGDPEYSIPPYEDSQLICIGDGDQSIYGFRGTDPDNCIRFREAYAREGSKVIITSMSENRRCPSVIIDAARKVIESNDKRIEKPIRSIRDGGKINIRQYLNQTDQMGQLLQALKTKPKEDLVNTCICYRNLASSYMLTIKLMERGIPFRFGRGNMPLSDRFSQTMFEVLDMLSFPDNVMYIRNAFFKVVPKSARFTKASIAQILEEQEERVRKGGEVLRFWEIDWGEDAESISGFREAVNTLQACYAYHRRNDAMSKYVPHIIKMVKLYYLNWQLQKGNTIGPEYLEYAEAWFSRDISYDSFMASYTKLRDQLKEDSSKGVYLTTMHGLKGLEFDDVYVIDLSDAIFPGTELTMSKDLTQAQKDILENEARRLFYVTITRTRMNLTLYFDAENPTRYMRFFRTNTGIANTYQDYMANPGQYKSEGGFILATAETATSHFGADPQQPQVADPTPVEPEEELLDLEPSADVSEDPFSMDDSDPTDPFGDDFNEVIAEAFEDPQASAEVTAGKQGYADRQEFLEDIAGKGSVSEIIERRAEQNNRIRQATGHSFDSKPTLTCIVDLIMSDKE